MHGNYLSRGESYVDQSQGNHTSRACLYSCQPYKTPFFAAYNNYPSKFHATSGLLFPFDSGFFPSLLHYLLQPILTATAVAADNAWCSTGRERMVIWKAVAAGGSTDRGSLRGGDADEVTAAEGQEPVPLVYNPPFFLSPSFHLLPQTIHVLCPRTRTPQTDTQWRLLPTSPLTTARRSLLSAWVP